ncbi:MAG TPA: Rpp14/Pop5 family protein [archaeon]|nr:Rpp14/Pop5 family protein [archaeon]
MSKRYVLVKVVCDRRLTGEQFHEIIDYATRHYFGELGFSRIDPRLVKFDAESSTAILSCERCSASEFESALTLITSYAADPMTLLVLRVSGTVKGASKGRK